MPRVGECHHRDSLVLELPGLPAVPAGPASATDLSKLSLEAWGSQATKVMGRKFLKTNPCASSLEVCSKEMTKVAELCYLALSRSTLGAFKAWHRGLPQGSCSSLLCVLKDQSQNQTLHNSSSPNCTMVGGVWGGVSCKGFPVFLISAKKLGLQIPLCL